MLLKGSLLKVNEISLGHKEQKRKCSTCVAVACTAKQHNHWRHADTLAEFRVKGTS